MLKINNASSFRRSIAGLCLILGPVLIGVGGQVQPGPDVEGPLYLDAVAASPGMAEMSVLLNYLGFLVFAVGVIGAIHIVRGKGVVLAHIGGLLAVAGLISLTALSVTSLYDIAIAQNAPREIGVPIYNAPESYTTAIVLLALALFGTAIGLVILSAALWRAGFMPVWLWPLVLVAFVLIFAEPVGFQISSLIASLLLIGVFGFAGVKLIRMSDREWERGVIPKAKGSDDDDHNSDDDEDAGSE